MGNPRIPKEIKKRKGTLEKSREKDSIEHVPGKKGRPNNGKLLNKYAEKEWDRIIPLMQQIGILQEVGKSALLVYCNEVGLYFQCMDEMKKGLIITKGGWQGPKPEVALAKSAAANILKYAVQFGLTPASADGISRDPKGKDIDDLLKP